MKSAPNPFPCTTCVSLVQTPRGKKTPMLCGKTTVNAHAERANPNGCGPDGKWWTRR